MFSWQLCERPQGLNSSWSIHSIIKPIPRSFFHSLPLIPIFTSSLLSYSHLSLALLISFNGQMAMFIRQSAWIVWRLNTLILSRTSHRNCYWRWWSNSTTSVTSSLTIHRSIIVLVHSQTIQKRWFETRRGGKARGEGRLGLVQIVRLRCEFG